MLDISSLNLLSFPPNELHINETITTTTTRNVTKSATFFSWQIFRHVTSQCQTSCPKCKSTNMSKANQCASSCCRRHIDIATATATATAAALGQQHVLVDRAWTRTCSHRYYRNVHREVGLSMNIMQLNTRSWCCCFIVVVIVRCTKSNAMGYRLPRLPRLLLLLLLLAVAFWLLLTTSTTIL